MNVTDIDELNPWADLPAAAAKGSKSLCPAEGSKKVCPAEGSQKARPAEGSKATGDSSPPTEDPPSAKGSKGKMKKLAKKVTKIKEIVKGKGKGKGKAKEEITGRDPSRYSLRSLGSPISISARPVPHPVTSPLGPPASIIPPSGFGSPVSPSARPSVASPVPHPATSPLWPPASIVPPSPLATPGPLPTGSPLAIPELNGWGSIHEDEPYTLTARTFERNHDLACFPHSRSSKKTRLVIAGFYKFLCDPSEDGFDNLRATTAELFDEIWTGTEIRFETLSEARLDCPSSRWPKKPVFPVIGYADQFSWALKAFVDDDTPWTRAGLVEATPAFFTRIAAGLGLKGRDVRQGHHLSYRVAERPGRRRQQGSPAGREWPRASAEREAKPVARGNSRRALSAIFVTFIVFHPLRIIICRCEAWPFLSSSSPS